MSQPDAGFWEAEIVMDVTCCSAPSTLFPFCLGSANEREVAGLWAHQVLMGISYKLDGLVGE